jgi:NAD(P)H-hydrate epimerase
MPSLNPDQFEKITQIMVKELGLGLVYMIENSGRAAANLLRQLVGGNLTRKRFVVLVGAGNCGAAGLVAARHLLDGGAKVTVVLSRPPESLNYICGYEQRLLYRCGLISTVQAELPTLRLMDNLKNSNFVVDALVGSGLRGPLHGAELFITQVLEQADARVFSLDLPTGLPLQPQLEILEPIIKAHSTLAFGLPRQIHFEPASKSYTGELYLGDIGIPNAVYQKLGLKIGPLFGAGDILYLRRKI